MNKSYNLVIITGMSGAGKTVAMQSLEDLGYFCIDNFPPELFDKLWELIQESGKVRKIALVIDLRTHYFYDQINVILPELKDNKLINANILFLDASDEKLVARYKETRHSHPLLPQKRPLDGIKKERKLLSSIKGHSQIVIDTTNLSTRQLRSKIFNLFKKESDKSSFNINVISFGFKYGIPIDADIVMDVRFLPNPYYILKFRDKNGLDKDVYNYVMESEITKQFFYSFINLLKVAIPGYINEGKSNLVIAIGCTGGQHRSVAISEGISDVLRKHYNVSITHRDLRYRKEMT